MALTKIITDTIDLSLDTTALKMPKGTTAERQIEYLVVAGGGGGAGSSNGGGGGGAGGLLSGTTDMIAATNLTITVGDGGAGTIGEVGGDVGGDGDDSVFGNITATGGGGAANTGASSSNNGGSGGGASGGTVITPGNGIPQQGNNGGTGSNPSDIGGGGGGAGGVGQPGGSLGSIPSSGTFTGTDGQGGAAISNSITGTAVLYAGGGGGGVCDFVYNVGTPATSGLGGAGVAGTGGNGGQSDGSTTGIVNGGNGTANTGGGGGGGSRSIGGTCNGGDGGSGIVILRYASKYTLVNNTPGTLTTGVLNATVGNDKYTTFTAGTGTISGLSFDLEVGTMRENTTTGKMEIYTGAKGWRALQQTGQDVGVVPSDNFNVTQYVGDGGSIKTLTGLNFQPDLTWVKITTQTWLGTVWDSVEGVGSGKEFCLFSGGANTAGARGAGSSATYGGLTSFNNDGWTSGPGSTDNGNTNSSGNTFVTYNWKVGGNSNTYNKNGTGYASAADAGMDVGNITPTGSSVNTENGISIIQWTGVDIVGKTIPHGFSSAPDVVITKANTSGYGWVTFTNLFSQNTTTDYLYINWIGAIAGPSFGGTNYCTFNPTTLEVASAGGNWSYGVEQTAYCFKSTPGFSLIGRYTGTGSATNTPIIYTGFKPAWIMIKNCNNATNSWVVMDIKRNTTSPFTTYLSPSDGLANWTSAGNVVNYYDNGFQIVGSSNFLNQAGNDFFFMCFAS